MTTLVTGAGGYLGSRIAAALRHDEHDVLAVRLRAKDALAGVDPHRVTRIVHTAAITRFDVDRDTARRVNVDGTAQVKRFAQRCPRLERFMLLSTLYAAGRRIGEVPETRHRDAAAAGFANHYEWSKWASEEGALGPPDLPTIVLRLPTVVAEADDGTVGQYNAFHHTLRLYHYGLLTLLPGDPATALPLATARSAVDAAVALLDAPPGIYQLVGGSVPLGTVIDTAFSAFAQDAAFRRRMLPRPLLCDLDSFRDLSEAAARLRGGPLHAAFTSVSPFAEQLYLPKHFRDDLLRAAWPGHRAADPVALVEAVCADLVATRWGRRPRPEERLCP